MPTYAWLNTLNCLMTFIRAAVMSFFDFSFWWPSTSSIPESTYFKKWAI